MSRNYFSSLQQFWDCIILTAKYFKACWINVFYTTMQTLRSKKRLLKGLKRTTNHISLGTNAGKYPVVTKFSSCLQKLFLHFNKPKSKKIYLLLLQEYQECHGYMWYRAPLCWSTKVGIYELTMRQEMI